jgi:SAM-dependent methyltransferase
VTSDLFDPAPMYDEDYLYFFTDQAAQAGPPAHGPLVGTAYGNGPAVADLLTRLLGLEPGQRVLDLGCGDGSLARALAGRGGRVTGLDSSTVFLARARAGNAEGAEFVTGDMRALPGEWAGRFDRVVNWSTAFGYFDDPTNRAVLAGIARVLRPGGRVAIDLDNLPKFFGLVTPSRVTAALPNGDMLVDQNRFDPITGRVEVDRTVVRDGRARRLSFTKRLFGFPELRDWLAAAGFTGIAAVGEDGSPLTAGHHRMVVVATLA